ncbi:homing endonuclease HNH [Shewanella sp. phage 1/4]|uniref:homing endonuclease HNH n=1 Tax=Shewanella phage 1/4 TaxID=1458859 RepID=UPI0004F63986|nr:homing endonuclease HNH [Shewanella sp. phage 1/4]AHK11211.1 homing endonuclease HNH [Shewanella sp. phage 1/4]
MSLKFKFDLGKEGWSLIDTLKGGYKEHRTTTGRWNSNKDIKIWGDLDGNKVAELDLTQGKTTLIDCCDLDVVCKHNWSAAKDGEWGYRVVAWDRELSKNILLHKYLFDNGNKVDVVDHINVCFPNSYTLDNRRCNIRNTPNNTHNVRKYKSNTTGYPNIIFNIRSQKYNVQVTVKQKRPYCPYYPQEELEAAILCRDTFKVLLHNHKGHLVTEEDYIIYCKYLLSVYDGMSVPESRLKNDVLELFRKIKLKDTFDLENKITEIRQRVKDSIK